MPASASNRRDFLKTSLACAAAVTAAPAALAATAAKSSRADEAAVAPQTSRPFPADFAWGVATAAPQVEGAVNEDGRKPSIWDTFCQQPGRIVDGSNPSVACDHYHRYKEDVALMAELGVKHYRFSLAWPRILPDGRGAVNEKGVDFYKRLVDCLGEHGIRPYATLYHWDCPQALQDEYASWQSRRIVDDFAEYASVVGAKLGDRVQDWMTLNKIETFTVACGYGVGRPGVHAPGIALARQKDRANVTHNALLAHGRACQALRASSPGKSRISVVTSASAFVPVVENEANIAAAHTAFRQDWVNGGIAVPLLTGQYDPDWLKAQGAEAPDIHDGDMAIIGQPLDMLTVNCYTGNYVRAAQTNSGFEVLPFPDQYPTMRLPWIRIVPESIYWLARQASHISGHPELPVYVTENGCAATDHVTPQGEVLDTDRLMYLRSYLGQLQRAIADGVPVKGYFSWSLMDNFEWAEGYSKRFGLTFVDYPTQRRIPKLSFRWMQELIRSGKMV